MEIIYFLALIALFVFGIFMQLTVERRSYEMNVWGLLSVLATAFFVVPIFMHISDMTRIKTADQYIAIQIEYKNNLMDELRKLPKMDTALMNADTPASTLVLAIAEAEGNISNEKRRRVHAERSIMETKLGPNAFVLWFYNERI